MNLEDIKTEKETKVILEDALDKMNETLNNGNPTGFVIALNDYRVKFCGLKKNFQSNVAEYEFTKSYYQIINKIPRGFLE